MNTLEKIKRSWWVLLSFLFFLNGFGFVYIGLKHDKRNWILEGITYEIPWVMYFIVYASFHVDKISMSNPTQLIIVLALVLMIVSIVRSIWAAIKLADVYDYNEKYTIKQTNLNPSVSSQNNNDNASKFACCLCLVVIFLVFAIIGGL